MEKLIVGSRGSLLAKTQTLWVIDELRKAHPGLAIEWKQIDTSGDLDQKTKLTHFGNLGVFVKELQIALLTGEIHVAVHSLKDVPDNEPEDLMFSAIPVREQVADVWIGRSGSFWDLPKGAKVGTGSPRRKMQLYAHRPDLQYEALRGNLDTRIRKVEEGVVDGIILAAAGMRRLGWQKRITHDFSIDQMIPAIGQGALALECRKNDSWTRLLTQSINDDVSATAIKIERMYMTKLGGGCRVPLAAHVYHTGEEWKMIAALGHPTTDAMVRLAMEDTDPEALLSDMVSETERLAKANNIPLPRDVPEHHLLNTGFNTPKKENK